MIATHMNAPYGAVVAEQDVVDSLRSGCFSAVTQIGNDILFAIFIEISPDLLLRCAREIGAEPGELQRPLYAVCAADGNALLRLGAWGVTDRCQSSLAPMRIATTS